MSMAQIITTICDACLAGEPATETPATAYRVVVSPVGLANRAMLTDLCADHAGPLEAVWEAVLHLGRPDDGKPLQAARRAATGERPACPLCGKTFKNRGSLSAHTRGQHGRPLGELREAEAGPEAVSDTPLSCPICGQAFAYPQGLGRHVRARHSTTLQEVRAEAPSEASGEASGPTEPPTSGKARKRAPVAPGDAS